MVALQRRLCYNNLEPVPLDRITPGVPRTAGCLDWTKQTHLASGLVDDQRKDLDR